MKAKSYVALLNKSDGCVVKEWIGDENGVLFNCISIDGKLYAVGHTYVGKDQYGAIYVFDENLNVLPNASSKKPSEYYSLAYDGRALYIGGAICGKMGQDRGNVFGLLRRGILSASAL